MNELIEFSLDTENAEKNYIIAKWYENQGHTAPAHTYYLRAAERAEDDNLSYQALIRASFCYKTQGSRDGTEKVLLENALNLLPQRPEAYYFLSLLYERKSEWQNSYTYANLGLQQNDCESLDLPEFQGKYLLIFQKAVAAWWWGRGMECRKLFHSLVDNYWNEMDEIHKKSVEDNITRLGSGPLSQAFHTYKKEEHLNLRFNFENSSTIERNYSQVYQDIFILSMLNGKKNGTFLEIGGADPFFGNNTALLEKTFGWTGVSIEYDEKFIQNYRNNRSTKLLHDNALTIDYEKLLKENFEGNVIDYLQLDIEPARNTYECMLKIPFDKYKFAVITYEHDYYVDVTRSFRQKSRDFLESKGYLLVANDISPDGESNFEDWWVHPDLIDDTIISKMISVSNNTQNAKDYIFSLVDCNFKKRSKLDDLDWGPFERDISSKEYIKGEIENNTYTVFFDIEEGDVVFDIGASIGPFTHSILNRNPSEVHCFEPNKEMFKSLKNNFKDYNNVYLNCCGIGEQNISNYFLNTTFSFEEGENDKNVNVITFKSYIDTHKIKKIDFLKTDCEGGEWSVFTEENYEWIKNNVKKVSGEFHCATPEMSDSFITFRNLYLKNAKNVRSFCTNSHGLIDENTSMIWDDNYIKNNLQYCNICFEFNSNNFFNININSQSTSWIVDNFYENPDAVREFALKQEYIEGGLGRGFIGRRTEQQFLFPGLKERFEKIMGKTITKWEDYGMNGRFQIAWSGEPLVYHCDSQKWGGMLYLTPDAPYQCGTTLYAHKKTRARTYFDEGWNASWIDVPGDCHLDGTPFEPVDVLGNVYNRLVIFDASAIHSASQYFGTIKENSRLWQMFFFDTK